MSWVRWLKGLAEKRADDAPPRAQPAAAPRRARKGGDAYAKEWVKVLEEAGPGKDAFSTYTWELHPDAPPPPASARGKAPKAPADAAARKSPAGPVDRATDPFDTYTWELQEGSSPDDPWGLKRDQAPPKPTKGADGVNPYDTGIFDASWTGRFDQR